MIIKFTIYLVQDFYSFFLIFEQNNYYLCKQEACMHLRKVEKEARIAGHANVNNLREIISSLKNQSDAYQRILFTQFSLKQ